MNLLFRMSYPTPSDYQEALQAPAVAFSDPELQSATPRTNVLGLPQPITGSFAAVFPVRSNAGIRYAVKCFLTEVPEQQARYEAVAEALDEIDHDAFVEFEYQPQGIQVNGAAYPLLKMEWAEGIALNRFVDSHLDAPAVIDRLSEAWAELMSDLEALDLAHGDLQHGNVLVESVNDAIRLRLVDYDTMFVPVLRGRASPEVGHRNYQHPDRTDAAFDADLDRFAGLVIYTALRACAERPTLWEKYDTGENLLFRDEDFYAPEDSRLFAELADSEPLGPLVEGLRTACYVEPSEVPPLNAVRTGKVGKRGARIGGRSRGRSRPTEERGPFARAVLPGTVGVVLVTVGALLGGGLLWAGGVFFGSLGMSGGMALARYRRLSIVRRRRRLVQEIERFTTALQALEREAESLREKRQALRTSMEARREERLREVRKEALHDCLKPHFIGEVREVEGLTHKHVVRLKAAGVRTAAEATPEALDAVRRISDRARARLKMWRASLEEKYADAVPDSLSPAQERRLRRYVQDRIEDIDNERARIQGKIEVQTAERDRVQERIDAMPEMTFGRYLRYLFRLDPLPARTGGPPEPDPPRETEGESGRTPVPDPLDEDQAWWKRGT